MGQNDAIFLVALSEILCLKFKQPIFGVEITKNEDGHFNWMFQDLF